jgi:hypothetical protein
VVSGRRLRKAGSERCAIAFERRLKQQKGSVARFAIRERLIL